MYTTKAKIEAYLGKTLTQTESQVNAIISSIDAYIDSFTNRTFGKETDTRYFDGTGKSSMLIDDLVTLTSVELNDDDITAEVLPYPTKKPHFNLIYTGFFTSGHQNVKIVGEWGFESIPADIEYVSTVLSAGALTEPSGQVQSEKIGNYQVSYGKNGMTDFNTAIDILKRYKRYYL